MKGPAEPEPIKSSLSKDKGKKKATTAIETLNSPAPAQSSDPNVEEQPDDGEDDSEEEDAVALPDLTPELLGFSKIEIGNYEKSYLYIQEHRSVYVPGAYDALLVAAYEAESKGQHKYAKQCVNQALLLQYCEKLGKDGPALFFRRYYYYCYYYYRPIGKALMNLIIGRSPGIPRLSRCSQRM
jgi:cell division cycle protein 37